MADIKAIESDSVVREPAQSVIVEGCEEKLTLIGSGATCLVYKTENDTILKEFFPLINGHIPAMARHKTESGSTLVLIGGIKENNLLMSAYQKSRRGFEESVKTATEIYAYYRGKHAGMCIVPETCHTLSGSWQRCPYTGGYMLYEYISSKREDSRSFSDFFSAVLHAIYLLTNDLTMYHECGFINLDIKPHNLYAVYADVGMLSAVRNLDFGSARKIDELISDIEKSAGVFGESGERLVKSINNAYFSTTEQYYYDKTINEAIRTCLHSDDLEAKKCSLIRLDAIAVLKLLIYALTDSLDEGKPIFMNNENKHLKNELYRIFAENNVSGSANVYEEYDCYFHLYDLISYVFTSENVSMREISDRIHTVLCIISRDPTPTGNQSDRQKKAIAAHKAFASKRSILSEKKLRSVADIHQYAYNNGLMVPPTCGELYYYLSIEIDRSKDDEVLK